jgi:hypothetical protein
MQEGEVVEMPEHRFYAVTRDNHIQGAPATATFESDQEAIQKAREMVGGHDIELWSGNRRICLSRAPWE